MKQWISWGVGEGGRGHEGAKTLFEFEINDWQLFWFETFWGTLLSRKDFSKDFLCFHLEKNGLRWTGFVFVFLGGGGGGDVQFKPIYRAFRPRGDSYIKVTVVIITNFEKNTYYKKVPEYCFVGVVQTICYS